MNLVTPRLETLPTSQRNLWPQLSAIGEEFVLYGGTALSLQLGGRQSIDFDFFAPSSINPEVLSNRYPFLKGAPLVQRGPSTATYSVKCPESVKVSFFGDLKFGRVDETCRFTDNGVVAAGLLDLAAQKVKVVQQRAETKDYLDICALLGAGITLQRALGAGQVLYPELNPAITLKALTFFTDGDLGLLPQKNRSQLIAAVSAVQEIPLVPKISKSLLATFHRDPPEYDFPIDDKTPPAREKERELEM
jgi:hypothetical protein